MDIHLPSCRLTRSESRLWCRLALCILALAAIVGFATRLPGTHASDQARAVRRARLRQGLDLPKREFVPGEILVRFKPGTTDLQKLKVHALVNAQVLKRFDSVSHLERVRLPDGARVDEAVTNYRAQAAVLYDPAIAEKKIRIIETDHEVLMGPIGECHRMRGAI